jgi:mono/diheme cytochrome c family protein
MRGIVLFLSGAAAMLIALMAGGIIYVKAFTHGFSARAQPAALEAFAANEARELALPADAKHKPNPVPESDEVLAEARAHWADHCATCHGNDGSGQVPMGQQMYPPAPDMRQPATQNKTDGELFYIIENGVRLTGMPGWGGNPRTEPDSWKLVRFIRHLPSVSQSEVREMESLNPKTPEDIEEERAEEEFLKGGTPTEAPGHHHHH